MTTCLTLQSSGDIKGRNTLFTACSCLARDGRRLFFAALGLFLLTTGFVARAQGATLSPQSPSDSSIVSPVRRASADHGNASSRVPSFSGREGSRARIEAISTSATSTWEPLGPAAVSTASYGLVTGRVSSIAFDPADPTGNRVYVGTTGGGVWLSQNAATGNTADVQFVPLTDAVGALATARDASLSIGAITVQPGGTGVVLAGTGDPNDALDSYYGGGLLRSTDGGNSWSLIQSAKGGPWAFVGEAFAGFAWSTVNPQLVVAAVSGSLDGVLANAVDPNVSYQGLYYSSDSGATWQLARITDGNNSDVQGPQFIFVQPDGNGVTSVVWNPIRKLFIAAVRAHGYYLSADGMTWTRLAAQPGSGLTTANCPTNSGLPGSLACPIFRGTLAVNPVNGDTFAWTTDLHDQDQGIWQDQCGLAAGVCANQNIAFGKRVNTAALDVNDPPWGPATIENGEYTLSLAAVPSGQNTLLLAGADDLWRCSLTSGGCVWQNATNAGTCASAKVAAYQHALTWSNTNPFEIFIGNDSGLWRSLDAIGETGQPCDPDDATHFQNLNSGLGSLAEVQSISVTTGSPFSIMASLGMNGTTGGKSSLGSETDWPQILGGYGGPVAIDPANPSHWYVNNAPGVAIHPCSRAGGCELGDFGSAAITNRDVGGDGDTMLSPAPFLVDSLDSSQLLVGTCRVWRGPANGSAWSSKHAISPIFGGSPGQSTCNRSPLIRSMAVRSLADASEVVYLGMYGALNGGGVFGGHVFSARINPSAGTSPVWNDLTLNPVTNSTDGMNGWAFDVSSISIDPHDPTGNTVYVTIGAMPETTSRVRGIYRSKDGGATWESMASNLRQSPANAVLVDPLDANTVYIALDAGVFSTRRIDDCISGPNACWSAYGSGLPLAPVTQLALAGDTLLAGTYGRGLWQTKLWSTGTQLTTAEASPTSLTFPAQAYNTTSSAKTVTVTNTGTSALSVTSVSASGDFIENDDCENAAIDAGASCTIQVTFSPAKSGTRTGQLMISGNISGGDIIVDLSGVGENPTGVTLNPTTVSFGSVPVGTTSAALPVTAENATSTPVSIASLTVTPPFVLSANPCGTMLAANSDCQLLIEFTPSQAGNATGTLSIVDPTGVHTVSLSGSGSAPPTDTLSASTLTFPATVIGQISPAQTVSLNNSGGTPLTSIAASTSGPFQVSSNCGGQLAADSSCTFSVVSQPTALGTQTGTLTIADALRTQALTLTGTGLKPAQIGVSPTTLNFATQSIGVSSAPMELTVSNTGGAPLTNIGSQFSGLTPASFTVAATTCGSTLISGSSCFLQVVFEPTVAGGASASLTISSSTLGVKPVQVALTGVAQAPAGINVDPPQMMLTVPELGRSSAAQTVTISNLGAQTAERLTLSADAPFSLSQSTCDATLAAGSTCSVAVLFTPSVDGAAFGMLTVKSSTLNGAEVILSGIGGSAGSVQMEPSLLSFATAGVETTSASQTIALTNPGPVDLPGLALSVSSGFQLTSTTCGSVLQVGAGCTASIAFSPRTAGQQTGSLTVTSAAMASPAQAVLSGMGFDFAVSVLGSPGQTISSGQTANFTIVLAPASGSSGTFTFQCGSLPANMACSFNPPSETVGAGTTGNVMVQIATGHAARGNRPSVRPEWGGGIALCSLVFLPFALRARRKAAWLAVLLLILMFGVVSCAGSGGGTGGTAASGSGNSGAGAGTYSIPVDVAANGISHSVTLTVTVD